MDDTQTFKTTAIRYWERRRIIYNLALLPPSLVGYGIMVGFNYPGEEPPIHGLYVSLMFALSALGANICYTFAYALEFLFGNADPSSGWIRGGRSAVFTSGILLGMVLALIGGRNIAMLDFYHR